MSTDAKKPVISKEQAARWASQQIRIVPAEGTKRSGRAKKAPNRK